VELARGEAKLQAVFADLGQANVDKFCASASIGFAKDSLDVARRRDADAQSLSKLESIACYDEPLEERRVQGVNHPAQLELHARSRNGFEPVSGGTVVAVGFCPDQTRLPIHECSGREPLSETECPRPLRSQPCILVRGSNCNIGTAQPNDDTQHSRAASSR